MKKVIGIMLFLAGCAETPEVWERGTDGWVYRGKNDSIVRMYMHSKAIIIGPIVTKVPDSEADPNGPKTWPPDFRVHGAWAKANGHWTYLHADWDRLTSIKHDAWLKKSDGTFLFVMDTLSRTPTITSTLTSFRLWLVVHSDWITKYDSIGPYRFRDASTSDSAGRDIYYRIYQWPDSSGNWMDQQVKVDIDETSN